MAEVESYITKNKHLDGIPSAEEMEKNGLEIGDFQVNLLQKIEELTLYSIQLKKENEAQKVTLENQAKTNNELQQQLLELKKEVEEIKKAVKK